MLLYLVEPESSRTLCCKVYKPVAVVFKCFFQRSVLESTPWIAPQLLYYSRRSLHWHFHQFSKNKFFITVRLFNKIDYR